MAVLVVVLCYSMSSNNASNTAAAAAAHQCSLQCGLRNTADTHTAEEQIAGADATHKLSSTFCEICGLVSGVW